MKTYLWKCRIVFKRVNIYRHNNNYNEEKMAPDYSKISTDEMKNLENIPNNHGNILFPKGFAWEKNTQTNQKK